MKRANWIGWLIAICLFLMAATAAFMGDASVAGGIIACAFGVSAFIVSQSPATRTFAFTLIIFAAVSAALTTPDWFTQIGSFDTKALIVPLLMIIMFGMGTSLSARDFVAVFRTPRSVLIGLVCQFSIMPILGFTLATWSGLPPEIAAGIILVGCSPGGLASNVMAYIANANLALSLSLTAVSTLLAPLLTPFLMSVFADQLIEINVLGMFWSISKIVILPIVAGLLFNHFFHGKFSWLDKAMPIISMAGIAIIIAVITAAGRDSLLTIGVTLVIVTLLHNVAGYVVGYGAAKLTNMPEDEARTIAFEVGMQNSGLASGIAVEMGKVATTGLAPAVFGPLMNISGSSLAAWWRSRANKQKAGN